jgi:hypothetical protein
MPCPECNKPKDGEADHRFCVLELLKKKVIASKADWDRLCDPKPQSKILGKKLVRLPKIN